MANKKRRLIDAYGREIRSLRFSITNRCNLNCIYCHCEGEERAKEISTDKIAKKEISAEFIIAIARVASDYFGIRQIKFSGGEPLMRADLADIVQGMRDIEDNISVTTNGVFLGKYARALADAGLDRVNVSLDSINEEKYDFITCSRNNLHSVIDGIHSAIDAGLTPVKLNMVLLNGINEDEVVDMMDFVRECNKRGAGAGGEGEGGESVILQLIELIPSFGAGPHTMSKYTVDFSKLESELKTKASAIKTRRLQHRRKYFVDGVEVEVVHPIVNTEFCANCSRLRITSDGKIKPCLLRNDNLVPIENVDEKHIMSRLKLAMQYREPFFFDMNSDNHKI